MLTMNSTFELFEHTLPICCGSLLDCTLTFLLQRHLFVVLDVLKRQSRTVPL
jgi:hypothetical protein